MNDKYLMDSNALATSSVMKLINSDFFKERCIVINEILYELSDTHFASELKDQVEPLDIRAFLYLNDIVDDLVRLNILLTDHGNGEAILLAEALRMKNGTEDQTVLDFMKSHPVIVTNEKAVDAYAKSIGIDVISSKEFCEIATAVSGTE